MGDSKLSKEVLETFFTPELAAQIESFPDVMNNDLNPALVDFALVLIPENKLDDVKRYSKIVSEVAVRNDGLLTLAHGNLLAIAFGLPIASANSVECRKCFVSDLRNNGGEQLSILHGQRTCLVGNIGNCNRYSYGFHFNGYIECIRRLFTVDSGTCEEV